MGGYSTAFSEREGSCPIPGGIFELQDFPRDKRGNATTEESPVLMPRRGLKGQDLCCNAG